MAVTAEIQKVCADFLGGNWQTFSQEIKVQDLEHGFCNKTYRCTLDCAEPKDVIVKLYGSELTASQSFKVHGVTGETIVDYILSGKELAPKLFGVFDTGRIEEFIYGRNVTSDDFCSDRSLVSLLARILVNFHKQSMPVARGPMHMEFITIPLNGTPPVKPIEQVPEMHRIHFKRLFDFPANTEIQWLKNFIPLINSKVVFAHNDLRLENIMLRESSDKNRDRLVLVDYEMSSFNYRGYDLAYFLMFLCTRVSKSGGKISCDFDDNLDPEIERLFIEEYLKQLRDEKDSVDDIDNYDHLLLETRYFTLLAALTCMGYTKQAINTPVYFSQFDSFDFISDLIKHYFTKKDLLVTSYPHIFV